MYCTQCGKEISVDARFCGNCGRALGTANNAAGFRADTAAAAFPGVVRRLVAWLIDFCCVLLLYAASSMVFILLMEFLPPEHAFKEWIESSNNLLYLVALQILALLAYFPWFDARYTKGSPGKRLLGITLITTQDQPPSLLRTLSRFLASLTVTMLLWPFSLMQAVFTRDKRMLHDRITGTVLVRGSRLEHASYSRAVVGTRGFGWWCGLLVALVLGATWLSVLGDWFLDIEAGRNAMIALGIYPPDEPLLTGTVWRLSE